MYIIPDVFRIEFSSAAERAVSKLVPPETVERALEMVRAIGETAIEIERGNGPRLARDKLTLSLKVQRFEF